jgi:flagellar protein FlaG
MDIRSLGTGTQPSTTVPVATGSSSESKAAATPGGNNSEGTTGVAASQTVAAAQSEPTLGQVQKAVQKINTSLTTQAQGIQFSIDSSSHRIVIKVIDQSNNTVIRQIPSKQALAIADSLDQTPAQGLLIKQQA